MKFRQFTILFLFLFSFSFAQNEDAITPEILLDSITINENNIDTDSILSGNYSTENTVYPKQISDNYRKKYKTKEFDYNTIKPKESLWERISRRFQKFWESIFGSSDKTVNGIEYFVKFLAVLIIGAALYFILRFLLGKDGRFFFSKKNNKVEIPSGVLHENIHEINFPSAIAEFENQKDYRSAIRYLFLFKLKKMADQNIISWHPEKTNTDYTSEIKSPDQKANYEKLSYIFENVWYGEQNLDENWYLILKNNFNVANSTNNKTK